MAKKTNQLTTTTTDNAGEQPDDRAAGLIVAPPAGLQQMMVDAMTGEEIPLDIQAIICGTDKNAWKTISVNGFLAPLAGNIGVGRVIENVELPSMYAKAGDPPRLGTIFEGYAWQYMGDTSMFTKAKTDPPYDPKQWAVTSGTYIISHMAFAMRLKEAIGRIIRVTYGPYLKGARARKLAHLDVMGEADAKKVEGYLNSL